MANPRTHPHPPGPSGRLPSRPPRHETLPPQNPPPEIQIRNPYYSNHSNNNHIFSLPKYLKYLISQHSRLTGAVRPLYPKHNTKRNYPPRGAAPLYITSLLQILQSTRPPFHNPSNFAPWEVVDFISIRKLSQPPSHHPSPTRFFRKSSESLIQYYIDSLYYITYNMLNKTI